MYRVALRPSKSVSYKSVDYANFKNGINTATDEYVTPITYSKNAYNFEYKNGALCTGLGIGDLTVSMTRNDINFKTLITPEGVDILAVWTFDKYIEANDFVDTYIVIYCSDKKLYMANLITSVPTFDPVSDKTFETIPTAIKYRVDGYDCLIFTTPSDGMFVYTAVGYEKDTTACPPITSMCMHYERLFATVNGEKISLWFSDDLDPTNWNVSSTEAGFINMIDARGQLNKVISFKDYIYIFREYGISRVTAYGVQEEFSVAHIYQSSTKIYENTVCECGDTVLMLANDGIYAFDGLSVSKLNLNIENILRPDINAVGAYHNGKYYLACRIDFPDDEVIGCEATEYTNNAIIEIDLNTGSFSITRGIDAVNLYSAKDYNFSELFCCYRYNGVVKLGFINQSGSVEGVAMTKLWRSPFTDFGYPNKDKILKELYFNCRQPTTIVIETESSSKEFIVTPKNGLARLYINIVGREFAIHFGVNTDTAYISNPKVVVGVIS